MTDQKIQSQPNSRLVATTPTQDHQQMLQKVQSQLNSATGESHQVEPFTPDSTMEVDSGEVSPGDSIGQFYERVILAKPGSEPSKSWLQKFKIRLAKKNPNTEIKEK